MTTLIRSASIFSFALLTGALASAVRRAQKRLPGAVLGLAALGLFAVHVAHQAQSPYAAINGEAKDEARWAARYDVSQPACTAAKACADAPTAYEN